MAQRIAAAAQRDGVDDPVVARFARLGTSGAHLQNAERDFHRQFGTPEKLGFELTPTIINVPMLDKESGNVVEVALPVLPPHELFATFYGAGERVFEQSLVRQPGGLGYLETFWSSVAEEPWVATHPAMQGPQRMAYGVPLFLHADETEYVDKQKVYVISISGLAHGDPVTTKLLVALLPSDLMQMEGLTNVTLQAVLAFVKWSFEVLLEGVWPSTMYGGAPLSSLSSARPAAAAGSVGSVSSVGSARSAAYRARMAGRRLAGEYFGVFAGVKGDQLWLQDAFSFKRYFRTNACCRFCHASQATRAGAMLWTNVAEDAPWRATMEPAAMHGSLVGLPGLHHSNVYSDLLHLLWVHGIGNDLVGSSLVVLAQRQAFSGAPGDVELESQLSCGYQAFKKWCRDEGLKTTAEPWKPTSVHFTTDKEYPYIGGKGADVRLISVWLHHFMQQAPRPPGEVDWWDDLRLCLHSLARFVHGVASMGIVLQPAETAKLKSAGISFVVVYLRLASLAVRQGMTQFKVRPKLHYFHHLVMDLKKLNPKVVSCFGEESYMGVVGKLAGRVHRRTMPQRTIQRYLVKLSEIFGGERATPPSSGAAP